MRTRDAAVKWAPSRPCGARPNTHNAAPAESDTANMITEIAQIDVNPGMEKDFEAGVKSAVPLFKRAKGCKGATLHCGRCWIASTRCCWPTAWRKRRR